MGRHHPRVIVESPINNARSEPPASGKRGQPRPQTTPSRTPLDTRIKASQRDWLCDYACEKFATLHGSLTTWRGKLQIYEARAHNDYKDRRARIDVERTDALESIFSKQNHSLGMVNGFADFAYAQARDDILGSSPWFAATPEGVGDQDLAERITKHAHWKFKPTNIDSSIKGALRLASDLGTAFIKKTWRRDIESYERTVTIAIKKDGSPLLTQAGDFVYSTDEITKSKVDPIPTNPEDGPVASIGKAVGNAVLPAREQTTPVKDPSTPIPANITWEERAIPEDTTVYDNIVSTCIDFNDIAFDSTAPELDLMHTDVFHRRSDLGLLDIKSIYGLTEQQYLEIQGIINEKEGGSSPDRDHLSDSSPGETSYSHDKQSNPKVELIEGYMRCDPLGTGNPIRIFCAFSRKLRVIFKLDYLPNVTPAGIIPIFPIRFFRVPDRVIGIGYHEDLADSGDFVDEEFNNIVFRDRLSANPPGGYHPEALDEDMDESADITIAPNKLFKLKEGKSMADFLEYARIPDANNRAMELLEIMMQMAQLRKGISSASQGELKGVPQANTATGVNQIISRGAVLLKAPIRDLTDDVSKAVEYDIHLLYANQNTEETFTWGEGKDAELLNIKPADVRGLRLNISLLLTQSQNQDKHQSSMGGMQVLQQYIATPEVEKDSMRPMVIQSLKALGFQNADTLVRDAVTDPMALAELLPPELQQAFVDWLTAIQSAPPADAPVSGEEAPQ